MGQIWYPFNQGGIFEVIHRRSVRDRVNELKSAVALRAWLTASQIDTSVWGTGKSKQVVDLWHELQRKETILQDNPPLRLVEVVQVIVRRGDMYLVEARQEFGNGRIRERNQPPAEKLKAGETFTEAAVRCLQEELSGTEETITLFPNTYRFVQYESEACSYPGLRAQYTFHILEAEVLGLPREDFWQDNHAFAEGDPIRRHYWVWRSGPIPLFDRFQYNNGSPPDPAARLNS